MTEIKQVGVAGAGTMGAGIAIVTARGGFPSVVYDLDRAQLDHARSQTESFLDKSVERRKLTEDQRASALGRLTYTTDASALGTVDLVIEAVFEDLGVKGEVLGRLNAICPDHTIFASNTSTLSITEIAALSGRPARCVGTHFCLPAQVMKLVEMSPGLETPDDVFETAWRFCETCGQRPVKTKDTPGFILNRFLIPFNNDVIRLIEAGVAEPADIDRATKVGLGYAMGPCELLDLVGLDTQMRISQTLYDSTLDPRAAPPPLLRRMVAAGHLGRKTGRGFYEHGGSAMFGG